MGAIMLSVKVKMQTDLQSQYPELYARVNRFINWSRRNRIDYWQEGSSWRCQLFKVYPKTGDWSVIADVSAGFIDVAIAKALDSLCADDGMPNG